MSLSGLCQICESREAEHTCPHCGTAVCEKHYEQATGLCAQCAERSGADDISPTTDEVDEDDVHRM